MIVLCETEYKKRWRQLWPTVFRRIWTTASNGNTSLESMMAAPFLVWKIEDAPSFVAIVGVAFVCFFCCYLDFVCAEVGSLLVSGFTPKHISQVLSLCKKPLRELCNSNNDAAPFERNGFGQDPWELLR